MILLKQALIECGISQKEFAEKSGYTRCGMIYMLNEGERMQAPKFDGVITAIGESPKIQAWMARKGIAVSEMFAPIELEKGVPHVNSIINRGIGRTESPLYAMILGDPNKIEERSYDEVLTLRTMNFFSIKKSPFHADVNEVRDIFLSEDHCYIQESMVEAAKFASFIAVVGEVGSGKSVIRKSIVKKLQDDGVHIIFPLILDKTRITASSLLDAVILDLSDDNPRRSMEAKSRQVLKLLKARAANGLRQVLMIEEAHLLNIWALKHLKQLYEMEDGYRKLLGIVLIGQPELAAQLDESRYPQLRELSRRIRIAEIMALNERDTERYVKHKFERVNAPDLFAADAFSAIYRRLLADNGDGKISRAYPLTINNFCITLLNRAAELGERQVSAELVMAI